MKSAVKLRNQKSFYLGLLTKLNHILMLDAEVGIFSFAREKQMKKQAERRRKGWRRWDSKK